MTLFELPPRDLLPYDGHAKFFESVLNVELQTEVTERLGRRLHGSHTPSECSVRNTTAPACRWFGDPGSEYSYSGLKMTVRPWVEPIIALKELVETRVSLEFNSVLLNLYRTGDDKVGWHSDNEPELGSEPTIASLAWVQLAGSSSGIGHRKSSPPTCHQPLIVMSGPAKPAGNMRVKQQESRNRESI